MVSPMLRSHLKELVFKCDITSLKAQISSAKKKVVSEDGNLIYNEIASPKLRRVYCGNGSNKEWHCNMYCWINNKK